MQEKPELTIIDKTIIKICLNCNYNDGTELKIHKDYLRSALNDSFAEVQAEISALQEQVRVLQEALRQPLRVHGYVISNASDIVSIFVLGEQNANKVAELLKGASNRPDWVNIRKVSITKTAMHDGWFQDVDMPDTQELIKEALAATKEGA